jgi:hypothetical protein
MLPIALILYILLLAKGIYNLKEEFEIPKGKSESVNRRRADNTMVNRKRVKGQRAIYKTYK